MKITIEAEFGEDGGWIDTVMVTSSEKLKQNDIPLLSNDKLDLSATCTESWASISFVDNCLTRQGGKGIGVCYSDSFGGGEIVYASFFALDKALAEEVEAGEYVKRIRYKGDLPTDVCFEYELSKDLFKEIK